MKKQRRRQETEQVIIDALRTLIVSEGFNNVGVNAVAKQAGVSKELIYRYFGDFNGLILKMMGQQDYWSMGYHKPLDDTGHPAEITQGDEIARMVIDQGRQMRGQPDLQEIRRWELVSKSKASTVLAEMRQRASLQFLSSLDVDENSDEAIMTALLLGGILYLTLRGKTAPEFFGLKLNNEESWNRIEKAVHAIVRRHFDQDQAEHSTDEAMPGTSPVPKLPQDTGPQRNN